MSSRRYPRDFGLGARMVVVMLLLAAIYFALTGFLFSLGAPALLVVVVAAGMLFFQYWCSDRLALFAANGRVVEADEAPELHGMIDRLCALADLPKPRVALAESDMPNAFATGRTPKAAVICVTTGLIRRLDPPELEAVLAHELSHIVHRDVAVMTIASAGGMLAGLMARFALDLGILSSGDDDDESRGSGAMFFLVVVVSAFTYVVAFVLTRILSRYRELSADRGAAVVTGAPATLAAALVKVTGEMGAIPTRDLRAAEPLNAFYFAPARAKGFSLSSLFATHPPLERRLEQLEAMERNNERG